MSIMSDELKNKMSEGCSYENGKLYMFTKKTVTVVEMTPSGPSAWSRRGVNTSFTQCHLPDVFREAMVDAAENCDDPGIEPAP